LHRIGIGSFDDVSPPKPDDIIAAATQEVKLDGSGLWQRYRTELDLALADTVATHLGKVVRPDRAPPSVRGGLGRKHDDGDSGWKI
jgi:hypothetical protein